MLDYPEKIRQHLQDHFTSSDDNLANFKKTTQDLLRFLFLVFPKDCISDYELDDILTELGYRKQVWAEVTTVSRQDDEGEEYFEENSTLVTGWCLKTETDLRTKE